MNNFFLIAILALLLVLSYMVYQMLTKNNSQKLHVGDEAPNFALKDSMGVTRTLSEFKGKTLVLYFYPKADTPGCTIQACSLRDSYDDFIKNNIVVLGISYDTPENQQIFKEKYNLPFILLSDIQKKVSKKYGAYLGSLNELFPNRITFIIDPQGKIKQILYKVDIQTHTADVLKAAQS